MDETLQFRSGPVSLEGRIAYSDELLAERARVLLCGPHPFLGGDMDNNVMSALSEKLTDAGCVVMRFNYRGIGASETDRDLTADQQAFWEHSTCPDYEADILGDCEVALQTLLDGADARVPVYVVGYSFGCLPALRLADRNSLGKVALISPPLTQWPIQGSALPVSLNLALFYSPDDFACPPEQIESLAAAAPARVALVRFTQADHFFIGQESALAAAVADFIGGGND